MTYDKEKFNQWIIEVTKQEPEWVKDRKLAYLTKEAINLMWWIRMYFIFNVVPNELIKEFNNLRREYGEWLDPTPPMMGSLKIDKETIQKAREYPVENLITEKVLVLGKRKKTCCPFHNEKTPSFIIYKDNSWHCFGCGAHGYNAIDFIMQLNEASFTEAVNYLI